MAVFLLTAVFLLSDELAEALVRWGGGVRHGRPMSC